MVRSSHQSNTKRKRKSNDLIWARDGDHIQEHPAYILENCNEDDDTTNSDKVWVEWSRMVQSHVYQRVVYLRQIYHRGAGVAITMIIMIQAVIVYNKS